MSIRTRMLFGETSTMGRTRPPLQVVVSLVEELDVAVAVLGVVAVLLSLL